MIYLDKENVSMKVLELQRSTMGEEAVSVGSRRWGGGRIWTEC